MCKMDKDYIKFVFIKLFEGLYSSIVPMSGLMTVALLDFYRTVDPYSFYTEMIRYNLAYMLLFNIDNSRCRDLLTSLLAFDDKLYRII